MRAPAGHFARNVSGWRSRTASRVNGFVACRRTTGARADLDRGEQLAAVEGVLARECLRGLRIVGVHDDQAADRLALGVQQRAAGQHHVLARGEVVQVGGLERRAQRLRVRFVQGDDGEWHGGLRTVRWRINSA
jgi:hypothetical protein